MACMRRHQFTCAYCGIPASVLESTIAPSGFYTGHTPVTDAEVGRANRCTEQGGPWLPLDAMQPLPTEWLVQFRAHTWLVNFGPAWSQHGSPHAAPTAPLAEGAEL